MFFSKNIESLTLEDLNNLVELKTQESITLEYKREIDSSEKFKKEIIKDISAMANSQGGYIIIGINEKDGFPEKEYYGCFRMINGQKIEEWLEQIVNGNVEPKINFETKILPLNGEKCILIIHIPMSSRAPHMVTYKSDNRYYRRYFVRHQYQVLPAEHYEIKELFERSKNMENKIKSFLKNKNYLDVYGDDFGENELTNNLIDYDKPEKTANSIVVFLSIPSYLDKRIDFNKNGIKKWLTENKRYLPKSNTAFKPLSKRTTLDGILFYEAYPTGLYDKYYRYLHLYKNAITEYGFSDAYIETYRRQPPNREAKDKRFFVFSKIIGYFWQFLNFIKDYYTCIGVYDVLKIFVNMCKTENSYLCGFGKGWLEPDNPEYRLFHKERCVNKNIQIVEEIGIKSLDEENIKNLVVSVATQIGNAYGQDTPRCFDRNTHELPDYW